MRWEQKVQYATISDIGMRRKNNQDSAAVQLSGEREVWNQYGHLFIVADGMGGHAVGELASKIAVDTIPLAFFKSRADDVKKALLEAIENANAAIHERGTQNEDFKRMGTTCVALVLSPQGAITGHVGDSRIYRIRDDRIEQLTFDHSLHWELQRSGRLKPGDVFLPEAKHVITRSLGPEPSVKVDINGPHPVFPGDRFVLCSDGLTGHLKDSEIGMIVRELPIAESSKLLVNLANLRGGSDNVTVVVVEASKDPKDSVAATSEEESPVAARPRRTSTMGPVWTLAFWVTVIVLVLGAIMLATQHYVPGGSFVGAGLVSFVVLIRQWMANRKSNSSGDPDATVYAQTYTMASARTTKEFMAGLAKIERELHRIANEESWEIDWSAHATSITDAREAIDKKQTRRAMSEMGKAIDVLVVGLHAHRKRIRSTHISSQTGSTESTREKDDNTA
ncbi:MAG: serine/threonine-protein phosphatase [Rhodopirellula sp.]|nr:serine/threonine-protein phosphatase [Rhodopirellula sp.]